MGETPLIETVHLKKYFSTPAGPLHAVDDINLKIYTGKTLGVVGESGCGKSTLGRVILRLIEATAGQVLFQGEDILALHPRQVKELKKQMQIIFQDPYSSLDPRLSVSELIAEPILLTKTLRGKAEVNRRVAELMDIVGLAEPASGLALRARLRSIPNSSCVTNRSVRSMCPFRLRSSTFLWICRRTWESHICSLHTTFRL